MGEAVLAFDGVSKGFNARGGLVPALRGVSLAAMAGVITGIIGPDGAGKTTLMRLAAGLLLPDQGCISVLGLDTTRHSQAVQAQVGYMPQRFGLYEDLTVQENLNLYADLQGLAAAERLPRYRELLAMTGLAPFTGRLAGRLSGGMKQKLGLACTLLSRPRLMLLDEPTVGVDPVSRRELWAIVNRLVAEHGMGVLLSTAYLDEAERCAEVILLHEGEVLKSGPPEVFSQPLDGRTFQLEIAGRPRELQGRLQQLDGIVDAVVSGGQVRVVTTPDCERPWDGVAAVRAGQAVPPRFEDGFVTLLQDRQGPKGGEAEFLPHGKTAEGDGTVIAVRDLSRRFGDFYAVDHISFAVRRGEVFGLLGANGAGKSTTFRMLCGLLPASGGELQVAGVNLRRAAAEARARIGYMAQRFALYGNLSVRQNLEFFARAYGLRGRLRQDRISWALTRLGLAGVREMSSDALSLGHKQRLALACALMHEPEILFLDEPTSGVDPLARREFWQRINALAEAGVTIMVTTHFMEEAEYCDRIAIMAAGRILTLGTPAEIKRQAVGEGPETTLENAFIALVERSQAA